VQRWINWQQAWDRAAQEFYRQAEPAWHFTTDAMQGTSTALMLPILQQVLAQCPGQVTVVDVGAGDGALVTGLLAAVADSTAAERIRPICIDLRERPEHLDPAITWVRADGRQVHLDPFDGLLIAHEFLDDLPCPWIECDADGVRRAVLVDAAGATELGPSLTDRAGCAGQGLDGAAIQAWLDRWWPIHRPHARCEPGLERDRAWTHLTDALRTGRAVAVDYGHLLADRRAGTWDGGTITGYRHGRVVSATVDGSCNITAHVSMDAVADGATRATRSTMRRLHGDFWLLDQSFGS
jgi:SAM-dependent MidA family methyltransferase